MKCEKTQIMNTNTLATCVGSMDSAIEQPVFWGGDKELALDYKAIYNLEKNELAQIASKNYAIIQHNDVLQVVTEALASKGIEVKGRLDNFGNVMRADLIFTNKGVPIQDGEKGVQIGIRVLNSYNRSTSYRLEMFGFRLVCQNGMSLGKAMNQVKEVTFHTGSMNKQLLSDITNKFIDDVINSSSVLQEMINDCMKDSIAYEQVGKLLLHYIQFRKHRDAIADRLGLSIIEITDKKTNKKTYEFIQEDGSDKPISRWDLYNAITNYTTFNEKISLNVENKLQEIAQTVLSKKYNKLVELTVPTN